jgi:hypothetical protein
MGFFDYLGYCQLLNKAINMAACGSSPGGFTKAADRVRNRWMVMKRDPSECRPEGLVFECLSCQLPSQCTVVASISLTTP